MVLGIILNQAWAVYTGSISVLLVFIFIIASCTCCKKKQNKLPDIYVFGDDLTNRRKASILSNTSFAGLKSFRRLSSTFSKAHLDSDNNANFTSDNLPIVAVVTVSKESSLADSDEISGKFDKGVLKLSGYDNEHLDMDDTHSCISTDSRNTFYSTYPGMARRSSKTDTFVSVDFETEKLFD